MLWLGEFASRVIWQSSDGGLRFAAAMTAIGLHLFAIRQLVMWVTSPREMRK